MNQETLVRPERYVKVCMALVALSLATIAVCQVILVLRPPPQPTVRRQIMAPDVRTSQPPMPFPQGMMPSGGPQGPGMPEGAIQRPPSPGQAPGQAPEKPAKK